MYRAPSPSPFPPRAPSPLPYGQRAPSPLPYGQRAPSPLPYAPRAPSPLPSYGHGPPSPIPPTQPLQPAPNSAPGSQIQPGTITYTTTTSPDGRATYHPFKAVPVSYQTANGIVSGIQWVPAEATSVLPQGAQPANSVCCQTLCPVTVISDKGDQSIRSSCHLGTEGIQIEMTRH